MPLSAEALKAIGYKTTGATYLSPEALAAVGYSPPKPDASLADSIAAGAGGFYAEASDLVGRGISNLGKIAGSQAIQDFAQPTIDLGKKVGARAAELSPTAATVGGFGADVLAAFALPGSTIPRLAASGAAAGLATSDEESSAGILTDTARSALLAGSIGGAISLASKAMSAGGKVASKVSSPLGAVVNNSKTLLTNSDDYARSALDLTLKKSKGDLTTSTADQVVDSISVLQSSLKKQSTDLYSLRDALATSKGIQVSKSNVSKLYADMQADIATGATAEMRSAAGAAKGILGTVDSPITFDKAETLRSKLSGSMKTAASQQNGALALELGRVRSALDADIAASAASADDVMAAHRAATDFYRESYSPIKGLDMKNQIMNKVTEDQFVANLVKGLGKKSKETNAFQVLPDEIKQQIVGTHQMALQEAATSSGAMDLGKYSAALDRSLKANPMLYKMTDTLENMRTLADVIKAKQTAGKGLDPSRLVGSSVIGAGFGAVMNPGFMVAAALPQAYYLHAAGKLINNKAAQDLLRTMRGLEAYPESALAKEGANKISKLFSAQARGLTKKALSIMLGAH